MTLDQCLALVGVSTQVVHSAEGGEKGEEDEGQVGILFKSRRSSLKSDRNTSITPCFSLSILYIPPKSQSHEGSGLQTT